MAAIAHSPEFARKAGVPQSVGKDFYKADQSAHKYAGGGNVSIYGGGERIRAPEATIMGGSGNKHIRTGQAFRPRWGAKPMGFAKGGTVEIKEVDDGNPFHRMVENLDQVTHSYHPDFGRGTPWPNRMIPQANIQ